MTKRGGAAAGPCERGMKLFGPADQAVVVSALANGALVREAAALAGFSKNALYRCRKNNPLFRQSWDAAVKESDRPVLIAPAPGRAWQKRRGRRHRFTLERKEIFLEHFAATCDAGAAAEAAGVAVCTVYDHRRRDPAFATAWDEALAQGYARLEAEAVAMRIKALEAIRVRLGKEAAHGDPDAAAEFERVLRLLREHKSGAGNRRAGGKAGPPLTKWSFEDAFEALEKRLKVFGLRIERGEEAPDD